MVQHTIKTPKQSNLVITLIDKVIDCHFMRQIDEGSSYALFMGLFHNDTTSKCISNIHQIRDKIATVYFSLKVIVIY